MANNHHTTDNLKYYKGQYLGDENEEKEFKMRTKKELKKFFKKELGYYICGFLNAQGGTLYIGVDDNGEVQGIKLSTPKERDELKGKVVGKLEEDIEPSASVKVSFVPVINHADHNYFVMEVYTGKNITGTLYSSRGEVCVRLDGRLRRKLGPIEIAALEKKLYENREITKLQEENRLLEVKIYELQHKQERLQQKEINIQNDRKQIEKYEKEKNEMDREIAALHEVNSKLSEEQEKQMEKHKAEILLLQKQLKSKVCVIL